jgi:hypothetical protein
MGDKVSVEALGGRAVVLMDSISSVSSEDAGQIVVSGSHGGRSSGEFAVLHPLAACFLNDAGVGKDDAGIAALGMLDALARPCAAYDSNSARIGDAQDAWDNGVISFVNQAAASSGFAAGEPVSGAIRRVFGKAAA